MAAKTLPAVDGKVQAYDPIWSDKIPRQAAPTARIEFCTISEATMGDTWSNDRTVTGPKRVDNSFCTRCRAEACATSPASSRSTSARGQGADDKGGVVGALNDGLVMMRDRTEGGSTRPGLRRDSQAGR